MLFRSRTAAAAVILLDSNKAISEIAMDCGFPNVSSFITFFILMETIKKFGACDRCRLYAVVNNGLYESRQNVNLLSMIRDWCADAGFLYRGSLAIGAGEVMGTLMRGSRHVLWPAHNVLSGLSRLAAAIAADEETETIYADAYLFPRWMYILIANVNWQRLKRAEKKK